MFVGACVAESGPFCIVSEYIDEGSLHNILHKSSLKLLPMLKLEIMMQVADALKFLHVSSGTVHGNIKSQNV